jgi:phenylacetate-CoA ligase
MSAYFDDLEVRDPAERERDLFRRLPRFLADAVAAAPGLARWLDGVAPETVTSRGALAGLPVLRKAELLEMQRQDPPFGGFVDARALAGQRIFMSPGPIWEPQGHGIDPGQGARAFFAAGIRPGAIVHNAFAYHMTPGGFILDAGARALGCMLFPAGTGNTEMQVEAAAALKPSVYCGTPDFLKVMLDKAREMQKDLSCFRHGLVSGGALFPSLRAEYAERGIEVLQCYATAEFGVIAYEAVDADGKPLPGMIVNENLIVEIVRPGTGDLSAILPGASACGRTGTRIKGWMGRADQRTKVKGMFVDPKQVAAIVRRHPEIARARLVVRRDGDRDAMELQVEPAGDAAPDIAAVAATLRELTKLGGTVSAIEPGLLPNDGRVIADERDYSA